MKPPTTHINGLRTVIYEVEDLEVAKHWYTQAFKTMPYFDEVYYVGFNIGGYELGLHPEHPTKHRVENVVCYWGVDDIHSALQHFLECGAEANAEIQAVGSDIFVASVRDPFGNVIGLIQNPHFHHPAL